MKIKELFSGPEKWTKGHYAQREDGAIPLPGDGDACRWCINGAALKCYPDHHELHEVFALVRTHIPRGTQGRNPLAQWNDAPERTFEEVKELVNRLDI